MNKNIKIFRTICSSILLFLVAGCSDNVTDPYSHSTFYPLAVGNSWIYNIKTYDSLGILISDTEMEEKLLSAPYNNNGLVYEFDSPLYFVHNDKRFLQSRADGLHILLGSVSGDIFYEDYLLFKYPTSKDDIYINGEFNQDTTLVISLSDTIICDAGKFSCIVYRNSIKDENGVVFGYDYFYVSYGVGKVKSEVFLMNQNEVFIKRYEYSLISYNLK